MWLKRRTKGGSEVMEYEKIDVQEDVQESQKKPYTTPQLTVHGDVEKITSNLGTGAPDAVLASGIV
jgi:hypothetical protein